jgi:hypothetical protein
MFADADNFHVKVLDVLDLQGTTLRTLGYGRGTGVTVSDALWLGDKTVYQVISEPSLAYQMSRAVRSSLGGPDLCAKSMALV